MKYDDDPEGWSKRPFADSGEIEDALKDPRYNSGHHPSYVKAVWARYQASGPVVDGLSTVEHGPSNGEHWAGDPVAHIDPMTGLVDAARVYAQEEAAEKLRQQMIELYGSNSMPGGDPLAVPQTYKEALKTLRETLGPDAVSPTYSPDED